MGKHHRRKQKKPAKGVRGNWNLDPVEKKNEKFEKFYKAQGIVPEAEWESFLEALSRELPHSFRFLGFISEAEALRNIMQERYIAPLKDLSVDGVLIQPPSVLPWYPKGLGYQMSIPRQVIRRELLLNNLHNFLVTESQLGSISRQESVSMLPPLFLDVRPHHKVLDMCAAPGSKTAQLVESILADESQPMPSGFVVANDSDNKRCYLLVHQSLKRLQNANCVVINQDARNLPTLFMTGVSDSGLWPELLSLITLMCTEARRAVQSTTQKIRLPKVDEIPAGSDVDEFITRLNDNKRKAEAVAEPF